MKNSAKHTTEVAKNAEVVSYLFKTAHLDRIKSVENQIKNTDRELASYTRGAINSEKILAELKIKHKTLAEVDTIEYDTQAQNLAEKFASNIFFSAFINEPDHLRVKTKLLFTDIRIGTGEKETKRTCLGAFEISISIQGDKPYIDNLTFKNRNHWATSGTGITSVCWGEWEEDIDEAIRNKNYYEAFEIVLALLRDADNDAAAYQMSNVWKEQRRPASGGVMLVGMGQYAVFTDNHDGLDIIGHTARCVGLGRAVNTYEIKNIEKDGSSLPNFAWNVPHEKVMGITKELYDAKDRYMIEIPFSRETILEDIDKLPDESTKEDAEALFSKLSLKLDIKDLLKDPVEATV